jgi:hypothetical protein
MGNCANNDLDWNGSDSQSIDRTVIFQGLAGVSKE